MEPRRPSTYLTLSAGHVGAHLAAVAGEHDGALHTESLQAHYGLTAVVLDTVVDHDVAGIFAVDGHMDDGAGMVAVEPLGTDGVHHLRVAHTDF